MCAFGSFLWVAFFLASSSSRSRSQSSRPLKPMTRKLQQGMRVNRALRATHSRREANHFISCGRIKCNGIVVTCPDDRMSEGDTVQLDDHIVMWEEKDLPQHRYIKYHKPRGVVCTTDRRVERNIIDELETSLSVIRSSSSSLSSCSGNNTSDNDNNSRQRRVYPIGRLDAESTGLILLTSDGDVVNPLLRTGDDKTKVYRVVTEPTATDADIGELCGGVVITTPARRDGFAGVPVTARTLPCLVERVQTNDEGGDDGEEDAGSGADIPALRFVIKEGRNRQIRKMCSALGLEVTSLHRVAFAGITLGGCEGSGECTDLTEEEKIVIGRGPTRDERRSPEERARRKLKKLNKKRRKMLGE